MKADHFKDKRVIYLAAFIIPVIMLIIVYALHGIYPFGDATVMTGDARYQFVDYLSYLKTIVFGNNDFDYSFSKNLGGNMRGFSAYYYMSFLNFITLLFPSRLIPVAQSVVILVTAGLCSLNFAILLNDINKTGPENLIFSLSYAFMGFIAVYFQLSMYFTDLALFPLVIMGLFRLLSDCRRYVLYTLTLFLAVLNNYYSGFMICIFCLLMFIYKLLLDTDSIKELKGKTKTILVFAGASLLSVMLSAFNLIPAIFSLQGEKNNYSLGIFRTFSLGRFLSGLYTCAFNGNISTCMPNIYCGVLMLLLLFLFFLNKNIRPKERVLSGLFLLFLIFNMYFNPLNVLWHGLNQPIGFPYRYSYMFSFIVILFSYRGFVNPDREGRPIKLAAFFAVFAAYSVFLLIAGSETTGLKEILITAAFLVLSAVFLIFSGKKSELFLPCVFLMMLSNITDLTLNTSNSFGFQELASLSEYSSYVDEMGRMVSELKAEDGGFYRIEKDVRRTHNDALQFDYAGLSHFSSSEKKDKLLFLGKLGLRNNENWAFYPEPSTMLLDSLLGVKHFISQFHTTPNHYEKIIIDDEYKGYLNDAALPLMFVGKEGICGMDYREFGNDPFKVQQDLADTIAGEDTGIFIPAQIVDFKTVNMEETEEDGYKNYRKQDPSKDGYVCYSVKVEDPMKDPEEPACLFAGFDAPEYQDVRLCRYDTDMGYYFGTYRWNIVNLETHTEGDTYEISLHANGDTLKVTDAFFYYEDRNAVRRFADKVREAHSELEKLSSSHLKGSVSLREEDECVIMSIPYDKSWRVYSDGKRIETRSAAGMLLSFDPGTGDHGIEMRYVPAGKYAGLAVSLIAALIMAGLLFCQFHKRS